MVPQNVSMSSPIHNYKGIHLYQINYYAILKEHLQILHKLHPKYFEVALEILSVLKFPLVEIYTYLPIRFVLRTDTEILSFQINNLLKSTGKQRYFPL